ncbi:MAG: hypothetical protein HKN25_09260 [Pyrinomonadaceae bacterium]|nr:hypothetical protein [Pyrinomonadaceae bacterium]
MSNKSFLKLPITLLTTMFAFFVLANETKAEVIVEKGSGLAVIKGVVRDKAGKPISKATVAMFRNGSSKLLKQVTASRKGRFFAKIVPGTYTILAVAQGFNPVTLNKVKVNRSAELVYGFKLERSGLGNTLPEKRVDRSSSKWRIRANNARRSIYQNQEGKNPIAVEKAEDKLIAKVDEDTEARIGIAQEDEKRTRKGQTAIETFVAGNRDGSYTGVNFATVRPISERTEIIFAGQFGSNKSAPKRFETIVNFRPNDKHKLRLKGSITELGKVKINDQDEALAQTSFQLLDQWKVRDGVVLVVGVDYSKFHGAGDDFSISPRLGFQIDVDSRTRLRTAYTTQTETPTWQRVIELEDTQVLFREPVAIQDIAIENEKPVMAKNRRLEFGVERILDRRSSVEANVFFDAVTGRGVGLANLPFENLGRNHFDDLNATQHGKAQGMRVVYNRRLNNFISTAAGYSFGNGQKLSDDGISNPADVFDSGFFQTFYGQLDADVRPGTSVRTIFRLSPKATVFAIDPFQGRLAIYDPGLSVIVTQNLPSWGLPIDAEAVLDARNLFDFQNDIRSENGVLKLISRRSIFRGGILVRF